MKDRSARPSFELDVGDEYRIWTRQEGNVLYRYLPRQPDWWDDAHDDRRQMVLDYFDPDDIFTLTLEISGFVALDRPEVDHVTRLVRNHWALSWLAKVTALADDPFTQDHVILKKSIGHHRLVAVAQMGAFAGYKLLKGLPEVLTNRAAKLAEDDPFDVAVLED